MLETILLLLLLLFVGVFGVILGVHLQAAKTKTDCGCGGKGRPPSLDQRLRRLEAGWSEKQQQKSPTEVK